MLHLIRLPFDLASTRFIFFFTILGCAAASLSDNGRTATLNDISYYISGVPVAQLSTPSSHALQDKFPNDDLVTLTVILAEAGSVEEYNSTLSNFRQEDDVFQDGFLQAVYISDVSAEALGACASFSQENYGTKLFMATGTNVTGAVSAALNTTIPSGPYFVSTATGNIFKAYRLYRDDHLAFTQPVISDERDGFLPLPATTGDLMTRSIAVPSRLYTTPSASQPLAGLRFAVKDIFHVKGVKTSGGSRAYYSTYGVQNTTAPSVQRLLDLGAVLVGKTGTAQFANGDRPTADWVDVHCPFNPRGDGYQQPSGSSTGSAVAVAAYAWLDAAVGSDTGGSMRSPARLNGVFGNRPSTGAVSMDSVLPLSPHLDTAGLFTRSGALWANVTRHWYGGGDTTNFSAYPRSIYISSDSRDGSVPEALALFDAFVDRLARFLNATSTDIVDVRQRWADSSNSTVPLDHLLNTTYAILTAVDQYNLLGAPLIADHAALHSGARPFINPNPRTRWAWGQQLTAADPSAYAAAVRNMSAFRAWWGSTVIRPSAATCSEGLYVYLRASGTASYRDEYFELSAAPPLGFADWTIAGWAGAPEVVVPVGEVEYESEVTGRTEWLPVMATVQAGRGCDGMLAGLVGEMGGRGVARGVRAGKRLFGEEE
ncbi:Amidase 1 [Lasiodiplodia hormozganensis]|uniref:Amidase 1 n=1 Tax=Lasiodiplodia hormozganensis TaxID=869390 RepID=A0AA39Z4Y5_9PEZI|nr:Amidase 1 [Lasiodiplodia hormozganensis]